MAPALVLSRRLMHLRTRPVLVCALILATASGFGGIIEPFDDAFELPKGFHIYRAAGPELSGGSYALTFDGEGRLLVGDGNSVRRLIDKDGDGVFDAFEIIATGLGWRGPQGLLVYEDRLYAVGGDGIQVFEGYCSGKQLVHLGRVGNKFNTGGDHDAHTIFRGHDGWLYFMAGNGAGIEERKHITEPTSPVLFEREASVFRISPDGAKWECLAAGGRNPPNLGMNYLGDLFSFDSDMEWHVGLPWYRPVRLNHWAIGGDQGWQEVGAFPPYYVDCLPGILDIGRGSPTWGVFYEHNQFPARYRDAFVVCDYRWKRESDDQYATTGRLVVFFLKRDGAGWKASLETLARPRPGARDGAGKPINFALVDVAVAPDGSLLVTDHNQGIWRIYFQSGPGGMSAPPSPPAMVPNWPPLPTGIKQLSDELLALPQPASERSRLRAEEIRRVFGGRFWRTMRRVAQDSTLPLNQRLEAIRLLAPRFNSLPADFLKSLCADAAPEIRGQAAWLMGIRVKEDEATRLLDLLGDQEPFVRRRAAEALTRIHARAAPAALVQRLGDPSRLVRYVAMTALAHYRTGDWFETAAAKSNPQIRLRALVASSIRREPPSDDAVRRVVRSLLEDKAFAGGTSSTSSLNSSSLKENRLDLLRVLALFQRPLEGDDSMKQKIADHLLVRFPDEDRDARWEQVRLLGEYHLQEGFPQLLAWLEAERDEVAQLHIAQAISKLPGGWNSGEEGRLLRWVLATQRGWFAQFERKGVEFPLFLQTTLADFGRHHRTILLDNLANVDLGSPLGSVAIELIAESANGEQRLLDLYRDTDRVEAKVKIVGALKRVRNKNVSPFLRQEILRSPPAELRGALLQSLAVQPVEYANLPFLLEGVRYQDPDVVRACVGALVQVKADLDEPLAHVLVSRLGERRSLFYSVGNALAVLSAQKPPGFKPEPEPGEPLEESTRSETVAFWKEWYERRFGKKFETSLPEGRRERNDEELHRMILSADFRRGDAGGGARVYERLQCHSCHGGGVTPGQEGRLFGPDLAGVTRRLSRQEFADAIVYPSKQVADRFKAQQVQLKEGESLTGFITEQTDDTITLSARDQVHRIARDQVRSVEPQSTSLMPERLLNPLTDEEIRDLLTFLDQGISGSSK